MTTEINMVSTTDQTTQQPKKKPSQKQSEQRIEIFKGLTVKDVQKKGSSGQKLMAISFDTDHNGVYDKFEARNFNSKRFTTDKNQVTIYDINRDSKSPLVIKYEKAEDLEKLNIGVRTYNYKDNNEKEHSFWDLTSGYNQASLDIKNNKAEIDGCDASDGVVNIKNVDLTIKNSNIWEINATGDCNVDLENVGRGKRRNTKLHVFTNKTGNTPIVKKDTQSRVKIVNEERLK